MRRYAALWPALAGVFVATISAPAQRASPTEDPEEKARQVAELVEVLRAWSSAFDTGEIALGEMTRLRGGTHEVYRDITRKGGLLARMVPAKATHHELLRKLLMVAEEHPTPDVARALLPLAAAGFERHVHDRDAMVVRDAAHWTLMRFRSTAVWMLVQRVAAGDKIPWARLRPEAEAARPALQIAALRLLGQRNLPVFRPTVESRLLATDPRIRLAAAEALGRMRRVASLPVVTRALGSERHPVTAQALVGATIEILGKPGAVVTVWDRVRAVRAAVRLMGRISWRTDLTVVGLVEKYPCREAVVALIDLLDREQRAPDELIEAVNERASPILQQRAWEVLCKLTGALIPMDRPDEWAEFWEQEKDRIRLVVNATRARRLGNTRATFYDIPITGREIAFLIDTSGSMKEPPQAGGAKKSRLAYACEQILAAVETMDPSSRYHVYTFSDDVLIWNVAPVPPRPGTTKALAECLGQFQPKGGTNLYAGLSEILGAAHSRLGQEAQVTIDELFVLSDGMPTSGPSSEPLEILRMVQELNRYQKMRINTVFTGDGEGAHLLRRLAEESDGVFVLR